MAALGDLMPPKAALKKLAAVAAVFVLAPPIGLFLARDTNINAKMSAPNTVVGAAAGTATNGPAPIVVKNDFAGVLLPPKMANIAPVNEGRVESVLVKIGQQVRQGDVILRFDPRARKHELAMAEAAMHAAQGAAGAAASEMQAARRRAARRNATVTVNGQAIPMVSGEEAAQAQSDARTAAARAGSAGASIAEASARVQALKLALDETEVKAPFDGTVTSILYEPGMSVHANETVARVVGGAGLRVRFAIPEEDVQILRDRRRARIAFENAVLYANVDQIAPEVEPASRTFVVEGPVEGGDLACGAAGCAMVAGRAVRVSLEVQPAPRAAPPGAAAMAAPVAAAPPGVMAATAPPGVMAAGAPPGVMAAPGVAMPPARVAGPAAPPRAAQPAVASAQPPAPTRVAMAPRTR